PLLSVDHPLVTVAPGTRSEQSRIRTALWLGHRVAGDQVAVEKRLQVPRFLVGRAEVGDDLRIARIGRLASEHHRSPRRLAENFIQQRKLDLTVARTAEFRTE